MSPDNIYEEAIKEVLRLIADFHTKTSERPIDGKENTFPQEDQRLMAMLKTKLQEALLIAGVVYNPSNLEVFPVTEEAQRG